MNCNHDVADYGKVAVLLGGHTEREVSLSSGTKVLLALKSTGIKAYPIDPTSSPLHKQLLDGNFSRVFIALHGGAGENGEVQGLLDSLEIPYTGSGLKASAIAMDKIISKLIWQSLGINTLDFYTPSNLAELNSYAAEISFPIVIKASCSGSSIGVFKVNSKKELEKAYNDARKISDVLVERWVEGDEYSVTVIDGEAFPVVKIVTPQNSFYDYKNKYKSGKSEYLFDTLSSETEEQVKALALKAYNSIGAGGCARVDIVFDRNLSEFFVLELNTVPGLTPTSLVPKTAAKAGYSFVQLICKVLDLTMPEKGTMHQNSKDINAKKRTTKMKQASYTLKF